MICSKFIADMCMQTQLITDYVYFNYEPCNCCLKQSDK